MGYKTTATLMERHITHTNKVTIEHQIFTTPITIKLLQKIDINNEITTKHCKLFKEIRHIDEIATLMDKNETEYKIETDTPNGK